MKLTYILRVIEKAVLVFNVIQLFVIHVFRCISEFDY